MSQQCTSGVEFGDTKDTEKDNSDNKVNHLFWHFLVNEKDCEQLDAP
jgi:hypothetical protein